MKYDGPFRRHYVRDYGYCYFVFVLCCCCRKSISINARVVHDDEQKWNGIFSIFSIFVNTTGTCDVFVETTRTINNVLSATGRETSDSRAVCLYDSFPTDVQPQKQKTKNHRDNEHALFGSNVRTEHVSDYRQTRVSTRRGRVH